MAEENFVIRIKVASFWEKTFEAGHLKKQAMKISKSVNVIGACSTKIGRNAHFVPPVLAFFLHEDFYL